MKCLIVEAYFNVRKTQEDQEKLRNEIIDQLRTSGIVIVDGRRCKVTPCEVDIVMLKPTETESSIEDAARFLVDPKNGDFDTVGLLYYKTPEGERRPINIYLAENEGDFIQITQDEYLERKAHKIKKQHSDDIVVYKHF